MDEKGILKALAAKLQKNELLVMSLIIALNDHSKILRNIISKFYKCDAKGCCEPATVSDSETSDELCDMCAAKIIVCEKVSETRFVDLKNAGAIRSVVVFADADVKEVQVVH